VRWIDRLDHTRVVVNAGDAPLSRPFQHGTAAWPDRKLIEARVRSEDRGYLHLVLRTADLGLAIDGTAQRADKVKKFAQLRGVNNGRANRPRRRRRGQ